MFCYNCGKKFIVKKNFLSLFETKKYYICDNCRGRHPINLNVSNIPLEKYELIVVNLFKNSYGLKFDSYSLEISQIAEFFIRKFKEYIFVYLDEFKDNYYTLDYINFLAESEQKNVLLVCISLKK